MAFAVYPQLRITHNQQYFPEQGSITVREGGVNCGAAGGAGLANFGHAQPTLATHHALRLAAGNPGFTKDGVWIPTGLSTSGITSALTNTFDCTATRHYGEDIGIAIDALKQGAAVGFAVDYATINAWASSSFSGDRAFAGPHFLVCKGWQVTGGLNYTGDWDSLLDGRHKTAYTIKTAPVWARFRMIRLAAGNFRVGGGSSYSAGTPIGADKGIFIIVEPA